ncbi:MAG TPA: YbjN domain-containing protein [Acidimicrobiales bacterium]|nr:YbjN domain-containing protein [Acidimicrobiales bacterium]
MPGNDDEGALFSAVNDYFLSRAWPISQHDTLPIVRMEFATDATEGTMFVQVFPDRRRVVTYAVLPERVPDDRRVPMAELLTRANSALSIGNFELNFEDGEVRFRTSLDLGDTDLTDELVDPLVQACLVTVGDHAGAIHAVIAGSQTPEQAIETVWQQASRVDFDFR